VSPASHRRSFRTPWAIALTGCGVVAALAACAPPGANVRIVNASGERLDGLRVVCESDSTIVPAIAPGESASVAVSWNGEDVIALRGRIGGRPLRPTMGEYVENGWRVRLVVDSTGFAHAWVTPAAD